MAVSITSRPSTWSAVKNPVVYKFGTTGGPFTNYRIEIEVFKLSDASSLTGGVKFSFSPGADDVTYADISSIVKAYLSAEWSNPTAINEAEEETSLAVYIKYQELYDGSATSVVDDVANPFVCVFAGLQIMVRDEHEYSNALGNDLVRFIPSHSQRKFLLPHYEQEDELKLWRDYPATLSFIYPDALAALYVYREQLNTAGTIIGRDFELLDNTQDNAVNRLDLTSGITLEDSTIAMRVKLALTGVGAELLTNPTFAATLNPWANDGVGASWSWASPPARAEVTFGSAGPSAYLRQIIGDKAIGWYYIDFNVDSDVGSGWTFVAEVYNDNILVQEIINQSIPPSTDTSTTWNFLVYITGVFDTLKIKVTAPNAGVFYMTNFSLRSFAPSDYTETITFEVADPCDNPVMLFWKNSLGGDSFWLFEHDQEVSYNLSGQKKAKRMVLSANNLTEDQWEALNELNHLGEVYRENIVEFTSSVNKNYRREGFQAYVVDADGNKTGVIIIPTNNVMFTRQKQHQFRIEIEFPERYE